ncbi:MAG: tRNA pseudouridine(55) synthase TruB [Clostridia bacterium]|nr:tRNA pseudouridine(55) synthase TruB [Clostridia bacterium]
MPLLLGNATRISKYLIEHDKIYEVRLKFGIKTDTADIEGNVIKQEEIPSFSDIELKKILNSFVGEQFQTPPIYSALKVNGKKLYEYARCGEDVEIKPRKIKIYSIDFEGYNDKEGELDFKVSVSKGTYIRSLCEDIAERLNTVGYMKELKRIKVGRFEISDSIRVEQLEKNIDDLDFLKKNIITIEEIFKNNLNIELDNDEMQKFLNGVKLKNCNKDGVYKIYNQDRQFIGLGTILDGMLKRDVIV